MAVRRLAWVAAALLVLAACSTNPPDLVTRPTAPPGGTRSLQRAARHHLPYPGRPASPWGTVPVTAPAELRDVANAYYAGAGPEPDDRVSGSTACLLLLPTARIAALGAPTSRFDVFAHFDVTWPRRGTGQPGLTLAVVAPGDPTDEPYFAPDAAVTTYSDGSQLRTTPDQPRGALIRLPVENCEYEVRSRPGLPVADDAPLLASLRLVYAP